MTRRLPVAIAILLVVVAIAATSGVVVAADLQGESTLDTASDALQNESTETEVPPHENPAKAAGDGNQDRVASYLASRLGERLGDSMLRINEGEYERGKALLGDDYDDMLGKYVEVAGDTGNEETANELTAVREDQKNFAEQLEEYEETRKAYEEALEAGDEERARELARELAALGKKITATGTKLEGRYERLENLTGENFSRQQRIIESINQNVSAEVSAIQAAQFVGTNLTVAAAAESASFRDPVTVTGRLRTDEGEPISNETVQLAVLEQEHTVTTDANGRFSFSYRPVKQRLDAESVTVEFRPAPTSKYLAAKADLPVAISEQTRSSIDVKTTSEQVQFRDAVRASGSVTVAENITVGGLPVELSIDGRTLATGVTDADGTYELSGAVPATVAAGQATLTVSVALSNAAVASSTASTNLTVNSTATTVDLDADPSAGATDEIVVSGTLRTVTGYALPGYSIALRIEDDRVGTVEVGDDGSYRATVTIPEAYHGKETVRVTAVFEGAGTNLDGSRKSIDVKVPTALGGAESESRSLLEKVTGSEGRSLLEKVTGSGGRSLPERARDLGLGTVITIVVVGLIALAVLVLARPESIANWPVFGALVGRFVGSDEQTDQPEEKDSRIGERARTSPESSPGSVLLDSAREALSNGDPTGAVETAYAAVRTAVAESSAANVDVPESATHWEFYRASLDAGVDHESSLEAITKAFEQAAFAADDVDEEDAEEVLQRARELV